MKIEKISENQIRCTLNRSDLDERQLKISELAYGSEKAKSLFREMMQQASYEFGFEAENIPLMIEAIPMSPDCIVLIITKVEDPDELDTRFSKFAPDDSDEEDDDDSLYDHYAQEDDNSEFEDFDSVDDIGASDSSSKGSSGADEIINLFNKVKDYLNKSVSEIDEKASSGFVPFSKSLKESIAKNESNSENSSKTSDKATGDASDKKAVNKDSSGKAPDKADSNDAVAIDMMRLFSFGDVKSIQHVSTVVNRMYHGRNSLYYDAINRRYYLQLTKSDCDTVIYNKVCNILSEYGNKENTSSAREAFFLENYKTIAKDNAIETLANI